MLLKGNPNNTLLISTRGTPIQAQSLAFRLRILAQEAHINKAFRLHALRHSIATHLMQAGMELEQIALFLGHKYLDSTQIYTHLVNEL